MFNMQLCKGFWTKNISLRVWRKFKNMQKSSCRSALFIRLIVPGLLWHSQICRCWAHVETGGNQHETRLWAQTDGRSLRPWRPTPETHTHTHTLHLLWTPGSYNSSCTFSALASALSSECIILLLVFKSLHGVTPAYWLSIGRFSLSSNQRLLSIP